MHGFREVIDRLEGLLEDVRQMGEGELSGTNSRMLDAAPSEDGGDGEKGFLTSENLSPTNGHSSGRAIYSVYQLDIGDRPRWKPENAKSTPPLLARGINLRQASWLALDINGQSLATKRHSWAAVILYGRHGANRRYGVGLVAVKPGFLPSDVAELYDDRVEESGLTWGQARDAAVRRNEEILKVTHKPGKWYMVCVPMNGSNERSA